jgi:non-ribosomal peptide synthase protein (TIGR01720 family)
VPSVGAGATANRLRRDLATTLPEFMLPSRWLAVAALPVTTNGKIDRARLERALDTFDQLPSGIAHVPPCNAIERRLAAMWCELLGLGEVGVDDNYFALGGDSIKAITLVSRLQRDGLTLALKDLFAHPTIAELAPCLRRLETVSPPTGATRLETAPLTPIQARRLAGLAAPPGRFNQTILLRASEPLDIDALRGALGQVVAHHEALRLIIERGPEGWRQRIAADPAVTLEMVDLRGVDEASAALTAHADRLQGSLDPACGRLVAGALYRQSDGDRLLLAVHHFGIDAVSWRILLDDLMAAYRATLARTAVALPPATSGYLAWAAALAAQAAGGEREHERAHWTSVAHAAVSPFPVDDAGAPNRETDAAELSHRLGTAESAALVGDTNSLYRTTPEDLLVTALMRALNRWGEVRRLRLALEGHGRGGHVRGLDISRTVGWFTVVYPAVVELPAARDIGYQIRHIKEQLRAVPQDGAGFGVLRWLVGPTTASQPLAEAASPVLLNYLGRLDQAVSSNGFCWDDAPTGAAVDGALTRHHEIELSAAMIDGALRLGLRYGARRFARGSVERLLAAWADELNAVADHLTTSAVRQLTPSDLNYSGISLDELESIVS